jgi:hypothetical protein
VLLSKTENGKTLWWILAVPPEHERAICRQLGKNAKAFPDQAAGYVMVRGKLPQKLPRKTRLLGKAHDVDEFLHSIHNEWRTPKVGAVVRVFLPSLTELHKKLRRVVAVDRGIVYVTFKSKRVPVPADMVREIEVNRHHGKHGIDNN